MILLLVHNRTYSVISLSAQSHSTASIPALCS
jgi:hypothetical protein